MFFHGIFPMFSKICQWIIGPTIKILLSPVVVVVVVVVPPCARNKWKK